MRWFGRLATTNILEWMDIMTRVLLTGGGGSIGVHVIAHIMHNTDWDIVVLDSFRHKGYRDRITRVCRNHPSWNRRINIIQHDIVCPISEEMTEKIGKIDYVLHLAAMSDVFLSVENPVYVIQNNVNSTLTMLEYARRAKPKQFIYFSTDEVYGPVETGTAHAEWSPHRPSNRMPHQRRRAKTSVMRTGGHTMCLSSSQIR